jgi:large subunit ribosomal protein L6
VSRIGISPVSIKDVEVKQTGNKLNVKGKLGELEKEFNPNMKIEIEDDQLTVSRPDDKRRNKSLHGLTRAMIQNMVVGVTEGYSKTLEIVGVGYRAELKGDNLFINVGYSHPIYFVPPPEVKIEVPSQTQIKVSGIDKEIVGLVAAKIRSFRPPEPYKGKGIKYSDEHISRKAGKTAG